MEVSWLVCFILDTLRKRWWIAGLLAGCQSGPMRLIISDWGCPCLPCPTYWQKTVSWLKHRVVPHPSPLESLGPERSLGPNLDQLTPPHTCNSTNSPKWLLMLKRLADTGSSPMSSRALPRSLYCTILMSLGHPPMGKTCGLCANQISTPLRSFRPERGQWPRLDIFTSAWMKKMAPPPPHTYRIDQNT